MRWSTSTILKHYVDFCSSIKVDLLDYGKSWVQHHEIQIQALQYIGNHSIETCILL